MKIEELKQGQAVWVKGFVDSSVFGGCGGFINFYNQDGNHCGHISRNNVREMKEEDVQIDQLEQQKPVVPQFVADWYEEHKDNFYLNLHRLAWELIENLDEDDFVPKKALDSDFKRWYHKTETAIQTLINMHQFGYTVEKEKLYTVEIPNPNSAGGKTVLFKARSGNLIMGMLNDDINKPNFLWLTESEIRKDFDWAWQWKKEVRE